MCDCLYGWWVTATWVYFYKLRPIQISRQRDPTVMEHPTSPLAKKTKLICSCWRRWTGLGVRPALMGVSCKSGVRVPPFLTHSRLAHSLFQRKNRLPFKLVISLASPTKCRVSLGINVPISLPMELTILLRHMMPLYWVLRDFKEYKCIKTNNRKKDSIDKLPVMWHPFNIHARVNPPLGTILNILCFFQCY